MEQWPKTQLQIRTVNMNYLDKKETVGILEISPDYSNKVTAVMQLLCPTSTKS